MRVAQVPRQVLDQVREPLALQQIQRLRARHVIEVAGDDHGARRAGQGVDAGVRGQRAAGCAFGQVLRAHGVDDRLAEAATRVQGDPARYDMNRDKYRLTARAPLLVFGTRHGPWQ